MTSEIFSLSSESAPTSNEYEGAESDEYLSKVGEIASILGYEGPPNRSLYELAMRMTEGKPDVAIIRKVVGIAHANKLISDQFSSNQLSIFRNIGDNSFELAQGRDEGLRDEPLWKRVIAEAEHTEVIYGDPDVLWADISYLYGFTRTTTFNSVDEAVRQENDWNLNTNLPANERLYSAPVWASYDMFSDEQMPPGSAYGKGTDW